MASLLENRISLREGEREKKLLEEMGDCYARYDVDGLMIVSQKVQDYADEVFLGGDHQGASAVLKFFNESMSLFQMVWDMLDKWFLEAIQRKDA